ncbi:Type II secretory protein PulC [Sphingomonas sp. EC-HK361]|uniref:type II secretion system protein N n=1 Tax=Sphingomonas sp. EC-HK361 TaxID=2038397 RepID=UPI001252032D|nr:type II secretion system protein N [Sphingomonas sp. EC-HK361]VVT02502.1 Type II secretory protein PulC [Sphingomonas sp. EC-HK361]
MRLKFDARTRAIFRRVPVINVYSLAELALLALLALQTARLVWAVLTPVSPLGEWKLAAVGAPGSPADILKGFDPFFRSAQVAGPSTVTSLQLKLFGTRIDEAMGRGSAIIAGPDGLQKSVAVGEEIVPGVKLKSVAFDHVVLDRGGADEDLFLDQSGGATPVSPDAGAPSAAPLPADPSAPPGGGPGVSVQQLQSDIGFIPRLDGGRISGLVVRPQGTGATFRSAGLRDGDIITAIGGRPVTGQGDLDRVAADMAKGGTLSITVERGGQTLPIAISIKAQ